MAGRHHRRWKKEACPDADRIRLIRAVARIRGSRRLFEL